MSEYIEIIEYIGEHGLAFAISGVFIYIVVRIANIMLSSFSEKRKNKRHDYLIQVRAKIDNQIHEKIREFLTEHNGTRVQVVEFSNSDLSVAYLPFRYMSCTYEVVGFGHKPEARTIRKLSTSLFAPFLNRLGIERVIRLDEDTVVNMSGAVHDIFTQIGSNYHLCSILTTSKNKRIGYVVLCKDTEITDEDEEDINVLAGELSSLLSIVDK